jgi:hypothetical protein
MLFTDFKKYDIDNFTAKEIKCTGAVLSDVNIQLIVGLQKLRKVLNTPLKLIYNGLTTGNHSSELHKKGYAVDFYFDFKKNHVNYNNYKNWVYQAIKCSFSGIGIYYCHEVGYMTMHLDLRKTGFASWSGTKKVKIDNWKYSSLFKNLKEL